MTAVQLLTEHACRLKSSIKGHLAYIMIVACLGVIGAPIWAPACVTPSLSLAPTEGPTAGQGGDSSSRGSIAACKVLKVLKHGNAGVLLLLFWGEAGIKDLLPLAMLLSNTYGEQGRAASGAAARHSSSRQPTPPAAVPKPLPGPLDAQDSPNGWGSHTQQQ